MGWNGQRTGNPSGWLSLRSTNARQGSKAALSPERIAALCFKKMVLHWIGVRGWRANGAWGMGHGANDTPVLRILESFLHLTVLRMGSFIVLRPGSGASFVFTECHTGSLWITPSPTLSSLAQVINYQRIHPGEKSQRSFKAKPLMGKWERGSRRHR